MHFLFYHCNPNIIPILKMGKAQRVQINLPLINGQRGGNWIRTESACVPKPQFFLLYYVGSLFCHRHLCQNKDCNVEERAGGWQMSWMNPMDPGWGRKLVILIQNSKRLGMEIRYHVAQPVNLTCNKIESQRRKVTFPMWKDNYLDIQLVKFC